MDNCVSARQRLALYRWRRVMYHTETFQEHQFSTGAARQRFSTDSPHSRTSGYSLLTAWRFNSPEGILHAGAGAHTAKLTADMQRVVMEQRLAFVATVCPDGTPNLTPKGTIAVWDDNHLVFADIRSPGTVANLRKNPAVEINVVDPFARKGYRFKGTGEVIVDGELCQQIMNFYRGRWVDTARSKSEARIRGFVLVKVESALPLISPAYDDTSVDEPSIRKHWISYFAALNKG